MPVNSEAVCEVCSLRNQFYDGLPPIGSMKLIWYGRATKHKYYFCSWDCVLKHEATHEPTRKVVLKFDEEE